MTSSPWALPAVPNYYTLKTKLLLESSVRNRSQQSETEVNARTEKSQIEVMNKLAFC